MEAPLESAADEVTRLRDCLTDLVSIIGLQQAHLTEQRRIAEDLDEALRESENDSRLLVDSIPGLVALLTADGELQFVNRQILEYTGRTREELKHWGTNDTVHPEDLPHVIHVFTQSIA